ncbi:vacuolar-sorting protein SNF8-like [Ctenocephalides felis]|uniref:vacuolar-sorting protein SNF8-like n=1 Tax=Ctenocephalides felis TaxID=7515 RepID=UPI000E6E388E|nr:vacuolar-sorting protein SNF8-like [Ctenocephalides felis]
MRRRAGIGAVHQQKYESEKYKDKGTEIQDNQFEIMTRQLEVFRENLEEFAMKHKNEIRKNAEFRRQFQEMCASIGVDPLASGKGFWSVLGVGDFYYELAVQVVEVCMATAEKNGGLITLEELRSKLIAARGQSKKHQEITCADLLAASKKLKVFGNGFTVIPLSKGRYLVRSVPGELSMDHSAALRVAADIGQAHLSVSILNKELGWDELRSKSVLEYLIGHGLAWIDLQGEEPLYWFPSLFAACVAS